MGEYDCNTSKTWLLGMKADGSRVSREEAAIIFWAWRCLYAEVGSARVGNQHMNPSKAYANLTRMAYTRVKAYGAKWYRWYSRQHRKIDAKVVRAPFQNSETSCSPRRMAVNDQLSRSGVLLGTSGLESMREWQVRTNSLIREIAARLTLRRENDDLLVSWRRLTSCD